MTQHNRAPLAMGLALTLATAGCATKKDTATELPAPAPSVLRADTDTAGCSGRLAGFEETGFSKDGKVYTITSVGEAACATLYDPATLKDILALRPGNELIGACLFGGDKPARLHTYVVGDTLSAVGDVNLNESGLTGALDIDMCPQGVPDVAYIYYDTPPTPTAGNALSEPVPRNS